MSLTGSCFCRKIKFELIGQPEAITICHCTDCRKITGSVYTINFIVQTGNFKTTSSVEPAQSIKFSDTGKRYRNWFCSDCGSSIYGVAIHDSEGKQAETVVVRAGVLDDLEILKRSRPSVEIYVSQRLEWIKAVEGCVQFEDAVPELQDTMSMLSNGRRRRIFVGDLAGVRGCSPSGLYHVDEWSE